MSRDFKTHPTVNGEPVALSGDLMVPTVAPMVLYLDQVGGDDANDGLTEGSAKATWAGIDEVVPDIINHQVTIEVIGNCQDGQLRNRTGSSSLRVYGNARNASSQHFQMWLLEPSCSLVVEHFTFSLNYAQLGSKSTLIMRNCVVNAFLFLNAPHSEVSSTAGNGVLRATNHLHLFANVTCKVQFRILSLESIARAHFESPILAAKFSSNTETFARSGELVVANGKGRFTFPRNGVIGGWSASVGTAPTGSAVNLRLNRNGASLDTGSIAAGSNAMAQRNLNQNVDAGDYVTVDITGIGSTNPGEDLTVVLAWMPF